MENVFNENGIRQSRYLHRPNHPKYACYFDLEFFSLNWQDINTSHYLKVSTSIIIIIFGNKTKKLNEKNNCSLQCI